MGVRDAGCNKRRLVPSLAAMALIASLAAEGGSSTTMRVSATILPYVKMTSLAHPPALEVTDADVARGYVDLESASSVSLLTNSPQGAFLGAQANPATVSQVALRIDGRNADADRAHVPIPALARTTVRIGYRLYLQPGVAPGRHPWPVALSVSKA